MAARPVACALTRRRDRRLIENQKSDPSARSVAARAVLTEWLLDLTVCAVGYAVFIQLLATDAQREYVLP